MPVVNASNQIIDCLQAIDLSLPGASRTVEHCLGDAQCDYLRIFSNVIHAAKERKIDLTEDRWWLLAALIFDNNLLILDEEFLQVSAALYFSSPATFLGEALVRVVEYCWFNTGDNDAIEYHYWACLQLAKRYSGNAEAMILERLAVQPDPIKRVALINAIGVLTHAPLLHQLHSSTVAFVISILTEHHEPRQVCDAAKEVLVEDIRRADREHPFLIPNHRQEIESLVGSRDQ